MQMHNTNILVKLRLPLLLALSFNLLLPLQSNAARYVRGTTRTSVHSYGSVNRNVNINRNVHVNRYGGGYGHVDIDVHDHYHPIATAAAVTATAAMTAAVVGSVVRTLPPSCSTVIVNNVAYQQCGPTWYAPQYVGTEVQYVVINPPR